MLRPDLPPLEPGDAAVMKFTAGTIVLVLLGALLLFLGSCTIAGEPCGRCRPGEVCAAGRCLPERAPVPSPGGPL